MPGGSGLNTIRAANFMFGFVNPTYSYVKFYGCTGNDEQAHQLGKVLKNEGISRHQIKID